MIRIKYLFGFILFVAISAACTFHVQAASFNAGNIIDDATFYNSNTMSVSQIQSFLNGKVPSCDTQGTQRATDKGRPDITRAQYAKQQGWHGPPYTCMKDFKQTTTAKPKDAYCNGYSKLSNQTAAQIIYGVAKSCGINPQSLIVLLQKEQGLITDVWPISVQYRSAMGMGCPDTAACDSQYYGFFNQTYHAARQFKLYRALPNSFNYRAGRNNTIQWHPNASCGSSVVYIQNQATAGLYNYTPYRPNQAALNAGYGTGNSCSSYGNRNFHLYFTSWFGRTVGSEPEAIDIEITTPISITAGQGNTSVVSFGVKNTGYSRQTFDKTIVQCRNYQKTNCDSNEGGAWYLDPNQERTFSYTLNMSSANTYTLTPYIYINEVWHRFSTDGLSNKLTYQKPDIRITSPINISVTPLAARTSSGVSFQLKNNGSSPIRIDQTVVQCRYSGRSCDSNYGGPITIQVGKTETFGYNFTSLGGGDHTFIPYFMVDGTWHQYGSSSDGQSQLTVNVTDLELDEGGVQISDTAPIPGQTITASFGVTNKGTSAVNTSRLVLQCRINGVENCDPAHEHNDTIQPGQRKVYSAQIKIPKSGSLQLVPYYELGGQWSVYKNSTPNDSRRIISVQKYSADVRLVNDITISPSNPMPGGSASVTYTVKNFSSKPAYYQNSILQCRYNTNYNCDPSYNAFGITIQPNETRTFTTDFENIKQGTYRFVPYFEQNNEWHLYSKGDARDNSLSISTNNLVLVSGIDTNSATPSRNSSVTYSYSVKNISNKTVVVSRSVLQCRYKSLNCDSPEGGTMSLSPGETKTLSQTVRTSNSGDYTLIPYFYTNDAWYRYGHSENYTNSIILSVK